MTEQRFVVVGLMLYNYKGEVDINICFAKPQFVMQFIYLLFFIKQPVLQTTK